MGQDLQGECCGNDPAEDLSTVISLIDKELKLANSPSIYKYRIKKIETLNIADYHSKDEIIVYYGTNIDIINRIVDEGFSPNIPNNSHYDRDIDRLNEMKILAATPRSISTPRDSPRATPLSTPRHSPRATPLSTPRHSPRATPRDSPVSTPTPTPRESPVSTPRDHSKNNTLEEISTPRRNSSVIPRRNSFAGLRRKSSAKKILFSLLNKEKEKMNRYTFSDHMLCALLSTYDNISDHWITDYPKEDRAILICTIAPGKIHDGTNDDYDSQKSDCRCHLPHRGEPIYPNDCSTYILSDKERIIPKYLVVFEYRDYM